MLIWINGAHRVTGEHSVGPYARARQDSQMGNVMRKHGKRVLQIAVLGLLVTAILPTSSRAETGTVRVEFTKGGFIIGVGGGRGVLTFRGRNYPFRVSGMSFGATIGGSTNQLVGKAFNLRKASDLAGNYTAIGAGGALAGGAAGAQLQNNANGVVLQLSGIKMGVELSAAMSGVQIAME
jgi:hypothetical protein